MDRKDVLTEILNLAEPVGPRVPATAVWTVVVPHHDRTATHDDSVTLWSGAFQNLPKTVQLTSAHRLMPTKARGCTVVIGNADSIF